jgi:hypothetical protein
MQQPPGVQHFSCYVQCLPAATALLIASLLQLPRELQLEHAMKANRKTTLERQLLAATAVPQLLCCGFCGDCW